MSKYFRLTILFLILAEIFSFCGFLYPVFNKACFFAILILALILSLEKLEYGIYIMLAELFIGSFGYLFFYEIGGTAISIRIGFFLIIMSVWLTKFLINKKERKEFLDKLKENKFAPLNKSIDSIEDKKAGTYLTGFLKYYFLLFLFLAWGVIWGLIRKNGISNVFFDANSYLYFALIFPFVYAIKEKEHLKAIFEILIASIIILSLKTIFLLFIFSHKMYYAMEFLYRWVRDFRLGEITLWQGGFYRIFFQSHIYVLIALFFAVASMLPECNKMLQSNSRKIQNSKLKIQNGSVKLKIFSFNFLLFILFLSVILLGMSRSFWVGGFIAVIAMYIVFIFKLKYSWKKLAKFTLQLALGMILSLALIFLVVKFPYPKESAEFSVDLLSERASSVSGEAGASSRWNLLPVLTRVIINHPIIGSGFGSTITYKSGDPRVLASSPTGEYTTYAFEWGYLDIIFKIGFAGMLAYLFLVWKIFKEYWNILRETYSVNVLGCMLAVIVILATSVFSPYMNHPLGIGYLMLCNVILLIV